MAKNLIYWLYLFFKIDSEGGNVIVGISL